MKKRRLDKPVYIVSAFTGEIEEVKEDEKKMYYLQVDYRNEEEKEKIEKILRKYINNYYYTDKHIFCICLLDGFQIFFLFKELVEKNFRFFILTEQDIKYLLTSQGIDEFDKCLTIFPSTTFN